MVEGLIALLIVVIVVAIVVAVVLWALSMIPNMDPTLYQIIRVLLVAVAALIIIIKALPLLGVHV